MAVAVTWQPECVEEVALEGGVANEGAVTKSGPYVLRPKSEYSAGINELLWWVRSRGFDGAPEPAGLTHDGRARFVFIEGVVPLPPYPRWAQSDAALVSATTLMKRFHEAASGFDFSRFSWSAEMADPSAAEVVCHNDVCLENLVFRDGLAVALLDFDFAAPGRSVFDLASFARMCVPVDDDVNAARNGWAPCDRPARLRLVTDAFGLRADERQELLSALSESIEHGGEFVRRRVLAGDPGFIEMWRQMGGEERFTRRRTWWRSNCAAFRRAIA